MPKARDEERLLLNRWRTGGICSKTLAMRWSATWSGSSMSSSLATPARFAIDFRATHLFSGGRSGQSRDFPAQAPSRAGTGAATAGNPSALLPVSWACPQHRPQISALQCPQTTRLAWSGESTSESARSVSRLLAQPMGSRMPQRSCAL